MDDHLARASSLPDDGLEGTSKRMTEMRVDFPRREVTSPATSPPRSPPRPRGADSSPAISPINYKQRGAVAAAAERAASGAANFDVMSGVADDGSPRVLKDREYHRAVLISHSRRDPPALNLTYALMHALRAECDDTGVPFSRHCHKSTRTVELWADKEQLSEKGGEDWNRPILQAMREGVATIFFLGNAFCGSKACAREATWAARHGFTAVPVFLEWFCEDEAAVAEWRTARADVPGGTLGLFDKDVREFSKWRNLSG